VRKNVKTKLSLDLNEYYAMKAYVEMEVQLNAFGGLLRVLVSSLPEKNSPLPIVQKAGRSPKMV
jgi:uncharacterized protein (AIM24 family)